jgi:hypothetical protein
MAVCIVRGIVASGVRTKSNRRKHDPAGSGFGCGTGDRVLGGSPAFLVGITCQLLTFRILTIFAVTGRCSLSFFRGSAVGDGFGGEISLLFFIIRKELSLLLLLPTSPAEGNYSYILIYAGYVVFVGVTISTYSFPFFEFAEFPVLVSLAHFRNSYCAWLGYGALKGICE